jgi:hypothetical protein
MKNICRETERRAGTRVQTAEKIDYTLSHVSTGEAYKGVIINMSNSGLCLYTHNLLAEGETISINRMIPNFCQKATVCWTRKIDDFSFTAGLSCC